MTKSTDLHNLITSIQDQHMLPAEESKAPYLGLFYVVNGKLYWDGLPAKHVQGSIQYKIYPKMHPTYWINTVVKDDPKLKKYDPYYFPRGRVVYDTKIRKYELTADACILLDRKMIAKIVSQMHLPENNTRLVGDDHYHCSVCKGKH